VIQFLGNDLPRKISYILKKDSKTLTHLLITLTDLRRRSLHDVEWPLAPEPSILQITKRCVHVRQNGTMDRGVAPHENTTDVGTPSDVGTGPRTTLMKTIMFHI
jgi:hypothetical protein